MEQCHIKSFNEYCNVLKQYFIDIEKMPSGKEIKDFISKYNLNADWKINSNDVWEDINLYIFDGQYERSDRKKKIKSYKGYLDALKTEFGIPKSIPVQEEILDFISKYNLEKDWGITESEILQDFDSIIAGRYDDMYKDAIQDEKKDVRKNVQQSYVSKGVTNSNIHTNSVCTPKEKTSIIQCIPKCCYSYDKNTGADNKRINKGTKKTIMVDGDNHIHEAEKGIEHTPKSIEVRAIFSQPGAQKNFDKKYEKRPNVSSKLVKPGNQAVDNQIKTEIGQILKEDPEHEIAIVSRDKGFVDYAKRKPDNSIITGKSVQEVKNKMNKR